MQIVNLTPHALTIEGVGTLPRCGIVPRCTTMRREQPAIAGVRIVAQTVGEVTGLPAPVEGVIYVVSAMVLTALAGSRPDIFAPDTGPDCIRENGQIVAVRGLVQ